MLEITNKVVNKDGQVIKDKFTYAIHYTITNNEIDSIQCAISTEKDEHFEQIGFIRKEGGRVNTDFVDAASILKHLAVFEDIMKDINDDPDLS